MTDKNKYKVGEWYYYVDIKFQIKEVLDDKVMVHCPDDPNFTFMLYNSWVDVGCISEEENNRNPEVIIEEEDIDEK